MESVADNKSLALANFRKSRSDGYHSFLRNWSPSVLPDYNQLLKGNVATDSQIMAFVQKIQIAARLRNTASLLSMLTGSSIPIRLGHKYSPSKPPETTLSRRKSVWETFSDWVEEAINRGNPNAPIRGGLHPKQSCLHVLERDRRFGHSNVFAIDEGLTLTRAQIDRKRKRKRKKTPPKHVRNWWFGG